LEGKIDAFFSCLFFHWANNPKKFLFEVIKVLKPNGLFLINFFGGATLRELKDVLMRSELDILNGSFQRISPFTDIKTIGDTFKSCGFEMNVIDTHSITLTHNNLHSLVKDLRIMGETSNLINKSSYLRKDIFIEASKKFKELYSLSNGKIFSTFEIVTITGWKPNN
tara:strand:+ start:186 stop:686 length:501 start_codon:yes stop_codon:yes gene_type:complete